MADCKVTLSIRGGSGRSIQDYSYCPQLLKHKMDGIFFKMTPTYYVTGRIIHESFAKLIKNPRSKIVSEDELTNIFKTGEYITANDTEPTIFKPDDKPIKYIPKILTKFAQMLEEKQFGDIIESESYYEGPLVNPETLKVDEELEGEGILYAGRIDLISNFSDENVITDFKTSQSKLKQEDADSSTQLTMYSYMYMIEHKQIARRVALAYFTKHTRDDTQAEVLFSNRHFNNYLNLYQNLRCIGKEVSASIDTGIFPKKGMIGDCKDTFNQLCPYHPICFAEQYSKAHMAEFESHLKENS